MSEEDRWSNWSKRGLPFFRGGLGNIDEAFKEMEEIMAKAFEELSKRAPETLIREQTLPDGTKMKTWGMRACVAVGPDGKPKVREFGNFKTETRLGKPRIDVKEKREPLADVIPGDSQIRVIVELPGVEKKDIKLSGTEDKLTISVDTPERKYFKEVQLPTKVETKKATSKYKNGILDITIPEKSESETINIE